MRLFLTLLLLALSLRAELTTDQKLVDFQYLAALYNKHYAPDEWKLQLFNFNLFDLAPWTARVRQSKTDLEFYDICIDYVASLNDSHNSFTITSNFYASLPIAADIYEGKVLIDFINRTSLPSNAFPFRIGDELVSVDGRPALELAEAWQRYSINGLGNQSTKRRFAVGTITDRFQQLFPFAHQIGESALVEVRNAEGEVNAYVMPWTKLGTPLTTAGTFRQAQTATPETTNRIDLLKVRGYEYEGWQPNPWGLDLSAKPEAEPEFVPAYLQTLRELQTSAAQGSTYGVAGFDALAPAFNPPAGFVRRLGGANTDFFLSGTYPAGNRRIGFIRIPTFSPANTNAAINQFAGEMVFLQANTDALVIDVMRNGGGNLCYAEALHRLLQTGTFRSVAYEIRVTNLWVAVFSSSLRNAKAARAEQWIIDLYQNYTDGLVSAMQENRPRTGDLPICGPTFDDIEPRRAPNGTLLGYTKPILVLVDGLSNSAAEWFPAALQDAGRATIFGQRTNGAGGNPMSYTATAFSEGSTRVTRTFVTRARPVTTPGFPASRYIENVGVYPDVLGEFMTKENLLNGGRTFTQSFTEEVLKLLP